MITHQVENSKNFCYNINKDKGDKNFMKKKELQKLARRIANAEKVIQLNSDEKIVERAKEEILTISHNHAINFEDMLVLDEMVQEILLKELNISNFS